MYLGPGDGLEWLDSWLTARQPHRSLAVIIDAVTHLITTHFVLSLLYLDVTLYLT